MAFLPVQALLVMRLEMLNVFGMFFWEAKNNNSPSAGVFAVFIYIRYHDLIDGVLLAYIFA